MTKKRIGILSGLAVISIIILLFVLRSEPNPLSTYQFESVRTEDLSQTVEVNGVVVPAKEVSLGFESSGKIGYLFGKVGTQVSVGTMLGALVSSDIAAQLAQAEASVKNAQAVFIQQEAVLEAQYVKLTELEKGTRKEEIEVKNAELSLAQAELTELQSTISNLLMSANIQAMDAVNHLTDDFFDNDLSSAVRFRYQTSSSISANTLESARLESAKILSEFNETNLELAISQLQQIKQYLNLVATAFNQVIAYADGTAVAQTTIDTNKTGLKTALSNVQSSIESLTDRQYAMTSQKLQMQKIQQELTLMQAPATEEQIAAQVAVIKQTKAMIAAQEASVLQAQANVQNIQSQFAKKSIRAPFAGVITTQPGKVGEIVSASTPVVTLVSNATFQIEAHVPEVDIGLIQTGQVATVNLDAYPKDTFEAIVMHIDPAETVVEGVSTYRIVLEFGSLDDRVKSGMTADVEIVIAQKTDVLTIPTRALIQKDGKTFVRLKDGDAVHEQEVQVGIKATGRVEILDGLSEGDEIVVREQLAE